MPRCWNWQTGTLQERMPQGVEVQVLLGAQVRLFLLFALSQLDRDAAQRANLGGHKNL